VRILTVVGARPQFVKALSVTRALEVGGHEEILVHTGQHYDYQLSQIFFDELPIAVPRHNLGVGSGSHATQTAAMLVGLEELIVRHHPDVVLVYGDTNSTLAAAVAAAKLHVPVAHVEAGLRSFNRRMPEEHNRVLTDHSSTLLFCPTVAAVDNLEREGITDGVHNVGDVMYDSVLLARELDAGNERLGRFDLEPGGYYLATVHRAENTDDPTRLSSIFDAFGRLESPVFLPLHPRTRARLDDPAFGAAVGPIAPNVRIEEPVGYFDMLALQAGARAILTDSGGVQKEALWAGVPCVTMRTETEWVESVEAGWNSVVGTDADRIIGAAARARPEGSPPPLYGDGRASEKVEALLARLPV
jgi:UDP-N-acetylglucosamine 2-epimerase